MAKGLPTARVPAYVRRALGQRRAVLRQRGRGVRKRRVQLGGRHSNAARITVEVDAVELAHDAREGRAFAASGFVRGRHKRARVLAEPGEVVRKRPRRCARTIDSDSCDDYWIL